MLRAATPDDLEALYELEMHCFKEHRFRKDHVEWILRNERCLTLLEENSGKVVAAAMLLFEGRSCRILSIAVMPEARHRGLATGLMAATEDAAQERGSPLIRLEVSTRNYGAIGFYRGLGYRTDGVLYRYYSWGEDAYSMSLPVTPRAEAPVRPRSTRVI